MGVELSLDPPCCPISAAGGVSKHKIVNHTDKLLAYKLKSSNNSNYSVNTIFGTIQIGYTIDLVITRVKDKQEKTETVDKQKKSVPTHLKQPVASPRVREWMATQAKDYPHVRVSGLSTEIRLESFKKRADALNTLPFKQVDRSAEDLYQLWRGIQRCVQKEAIKFNKDRHAVEEQKDKSKKEVEDEVEQLMEGTMFVKNMLYYLNYLVDVDDVKKKPLEEK